MEREDCLTEGDITERTLYTSRFDVSKQDIETENASFTIYDTFSFSKKAASKHLSQKPFQPARSPKKHGLPKSTQIFKLEQLLAFSEYRYQDSVNQLLQAISRNRKLSALCIVGFFARVLPFLRAFNRELRRTYLWRWRANSSRSKPRPKKSSWAQKVAICMKQLDRNFKQGLLSTFLNFKENSYMVHLLKQRAPEKLSRKDSKVGENTKKEFKQAMKRKHHNENRMYERAMGSSFFK